MIRIAPLALATLLAASAPAYIFAQTPRFTDPANLRGERVAPRTGRELPIDQGALGLEQLLRKLSTRASILNIVAHPDDEDGGMLTLYARGLGARVADLSLTRGEGGQNAVTADFEDALGLLRTQELLANDRYTGVDQFFGTEVDFGFSKTKSESFAKWNHQRVLYDVVRAIRLYRPLVLTSTWIGNPTDGHGQHQVAGEIAQEAFLAAGNPNIFPELTREGILPWQPLKIYARVPMQAITPRGLFDYATGQYVPAEFTNYVTGKTSTTPPTPDITIHEGTPDPLLTTCAANPSDLPPQLRAASVSSTLSSRPQPATNLSSRPKARSAGAERPASPDSAATTDCRPLTYVQFARIGLGLQRTQIGPGIRNAPSGPFDVAYHLYASRVCTSSLPSPTPQLCHPERSAQRAVEGPRGSETSHNSPPLFHQELQTPDAFTTQPNFFDGIDTSIEGIATLAPSARGAIAVVIKTNLSGIEHSIAEAQLDFKPDHPELAAHRLSEALTLTNMALKNIEGFSPSQLPADEKVNLLHELRIKRVQLNDALALSTGLSIDATAIPIAGRADVPADTSVEVHITLSQTSPNPLELHDTHLSVDNHSRCERTWIGAGHTAYADLMLSKHPVDESMTVPADCSDVVTRPYFKRNNIEQPYYDLDHPELRNAATSPPALVAWATVGDARVGRIVHDGPQPVSFVPPANLAVAPHAQVLPNSDKYARFLTELHPAAKPALIPKITVPKGWTASPLVTDVRADGYSFFKLDAPRPPRSAIILSAAVELPDHKLIREGFRPIGYGDLPRTNFYTPATDRIVPVDLKLPEHHRIAYLPGTGDAVPEALASIGLKPTILTVADLTPAKLAAFDTIILGVRTYNAHPDLHGAPTQALLDFARSGGNVVVQYQSAEFTAADAPFPLELGRSAEKVVDETAPVEILHPNSTLLTTPNHIVTSDFDHWIEERGHGFLASWDPRYTALTETHDPGQSPQKGGLITVRLGKGRWTYCAFALYRQLPEAVPGAFRLFTNLLNP